MNEIDLEQWSQELLADLKGFVDYWKSNQEIASNNFPNKLLPGDWSEQFLAYLSIKD